MRVLVVGCGYVGLALGAELVRQGHEVSGLRRRHWSDADAKRAGIRPVVADVTLPESLLLLPPAYDWVVNCVSASGGGPGEYERVYLQGTRNLINWLSAAPPLKLVYTSSTSVYGQQDGRTVDESSPASPPSDTGRILLQTEQALLEAAALGLPAVILRVAAIYGPGRAHWLEQVRAGVARVDGAGERVLNMIHRDDVVGSIIVALEHGGAGQIYNAVDVEPVSQRVLLEWLSARLNQPLATGAPKSSNVNKRGLTNKRVSNRRLTEELRYQFRFPSFRQGYASLLET